MNKPFCLYNITKNTEQEYFNPQDYKSPKISHYQYTILYDRATGKNLIYVDSNDSYRLEFSRLPKIMKEDDDVCEMPLDRGIQIIPYIVTGELLIEADEPNR